MKALLEKVSMCPCVLGLDVGKALMLGLLGSVRFSSLLGFRVTHLTHSFPSVTPRYLQTSFVWIHEPWQRLMSSLWSRKRRNG